MTTATTIAHFAILFSIRRRAITSGPMPAPNRLGIGILWIAMLGLLANAVGRPIAPGPCLFDAAMILVFATGVWAVVGRVGTLLSAHAIEDDRDPSRG